MGEAWSSLDLPASCLLGGGSDISAYHARCKITCLACLFKCICSLLVHHLEDGLQSLYLEYELE